MVVMVMVDVRYSLLAHFAEVTVILFFFAVLEPQ